MFQLVTHTENWDSSAILGLIGFIVVVLFFTFLIYFYATRARYKKFVRKHSVALKKTTEINKNYKFIPIQNFDAEHSYDNLNYYENISCEDYLIYKLVRIGDDVTKAISDTSKNNVLYKKYWNEINDKCKCGEYDTDKVLRNKKRLYKYEMLLGKEAMLKPVINFEIKITLRHTNINGFERSSKSMSFSAVHIEKLIREIKRKTGNRYDSEYIWRALARVERGKVTNKLRFAIYDRDGWRCKKCGSRKNLEIDHIYPIAMGGKTTFDNLQTLCQKCNKAKGATYEKY